MWGVCDREVGVVREAHQRGEEGVGCVGRVILFDCEGQGECHEEVQEGAFRSSLGDPAAWLQEGGEACTYDLTMSPSQTSVAAVLQKPLRSRFGRRRHHLWLLLRNMCQFSAQ